MKWKSKCTSWADDYYLFIKSKLQKTIRKRVNLSDIICDEIWMFFFRSATSDSLYNTNSHHEHHIKLDINYSDCFAWAQTSPLNTVAILSNKYCIAIWWPTHLNAYTSGIGALWNNKKALLRSKSLNVMAIDIQFEAWHCKLLYIAHICLLSTIQTFKNISDHTKSLRIINRLSS